MDSTLLHRREHDISSSCRVKIYPDGGVEVLSAERPIFRAVDGWETEPEGRILKAAGTPEGLERSRRRAIARITDYARCTPFEWFVTLTLDKEKIDRYDYAEVVRKLGVYCSNRVQRQGLRYVLVAEPHKDGALHFHGFFGGLPDSDFIPSGTFTGGPVKGSPRRPRTARELVRWVEAGAKEVFNLSSWRYGFTTAVRLGENHDAAITYICKYIRKAPAKTGGRWYLSGGELRSPEVRYTDWTVGQVSNFPDSYAFAVPGNGFVMWRGSAVALAALIGSAC